MVTSLGIHIGHHSSCALVIDGELVAAIQAERISRKKHHVSHCFNNDIPIRQVLNTAEIMLDDVDIIVSCVQSVAPGGIGLGTSIVADDFDLFDVFDKRHYVISHHLAHAHCAKELSGFSTCAALVCDYAGSATLDGNDFGVEFTEWYSTLINQHSAPQTLVENLTMYDISNSLCYRPIRRAYNLPHINQDSFVYSPSGLYANVSSYIFQSDHAYGQLMALASFGRNYEGSKSDPGILVEGENYSSLKFRNDWQFRYKHVSSLTFADKAILAYRCQQALEHSVKIYTRELRANSNHSNLVLSGGVFLNINLNTAIKDLDLFRQVFVPTCPHDAGISVGCAYWGLRKKDFQLSTTRIKTDRLGPKYCSNQIDKVLQAADDYISVMDMNTTQVATSLHDGQIIARWNHQSEFGPRALGARSILASPLLHSSKRLLNEIKGRQSWRPVAPIVIDTFYNEVFDGCPDSPWMTYLHYVKDIHRTTLKALEHSDSSTRTQVLLRENDEALYELIEGFRTVSGYAVLVNTSLNRRGEPLAETPHDALSIFLACSKIDAIIINDYIVKRKDDWHLKITSLVRLSIHAILKCSLGISSQSYSIRYHEYVWPLSERLYLDLLELRISALPLCDLMAHHYSTQESTLLLELLFAGCLHKEL